MAAAHSVLLLLRLSTRTSTSLPLIIPNKLSSTPRVVAAGGLRWGSRRNVGATAWAGRFGFEFQDEVYYTDSEDDGFRFGGPSKQRVWWFDDDENDDDDIWDVEGEEESGFWIFKFMRAFGWMVPAIAMSLLLGTGPNAFFMALAVPLGQTALSLVVDKVWGSTRSRPKPRRRTKTRKKPFARAANPTKTSERKEEENKTGKVEGSYQSWVTADDGSYMKGNRQAPGFGGWDELDGENFKVPRGTPGQQANGLPKQQSFQNRGKLSRSGRIRDTPLLLRLLIAAFPFLASWTRFLF
uniref:Uncharacterized protein MANES_08G141600 n=2 Tax=Rhizophora mucronata TaxID=61149 RepID=A0A2P2ISU2_RHIMU